MKRLLYLTLLLTLPQTSAMARDAACGNYEGVHVGRVIGTAALKMINKCVPLYCSKTLKDPGTVDVLRTFDDLLSQYHGEVVAYNELVVQFAKVCRRLNGKICQDCADLKESQKLYPRIGIKADQVEEIEQKVAQAKSVVIPMAKVEGLNERDPCLQDIKAQHEAELQTKRSIEQNVGGIQCQPKQ